MPNASLSIDGTEVISKVSGTITQTFPGPNHTFTVKTENSAIVGANYNTSDNATSDQLAIYNGDTKLWGINESGWVQQPNVPSFRSRSTTYDGTTGKVTNFDTSANNEFDYRNIGNHFNTTTGIFTCPIDGKYLLIVKHKASTGTTARRIGYLYINGVNTGEWIESYGQYDDTTAADIWNLSAGDTIQFAVHVSYSFQSIIASIEFLG